MGPSISVTELKKPISGGFIRKYHLASASAVQRSLSALQEKDILTNNNGQYYVYDYFLYDWLNFYSK